MGIRHSAPSSTFVPSATQTIAEHRMYLPLGHSRSYSVGVFHIAGRNRAIVCGALVGILMALTIQRNEATARNPASGWTPRRSGVKWACVLNAGSALVRRDAERGDALSDRGIASQAWQREVLENMGTHMSMGDYPVAVQKFEEALRVNSNDANLHVNAAMRLLLLGGRKKPRDILPKLCASSRKTPRPTAAWASAVRARPNARSLGTFRESRESRTRTLREA